MPEHITSPNLRSYSLEKAVELSREYGMEFLFYFRLFDDYYPGLEEGFLDSRPDLWWQSRCGHFNLRG